MAVNAKKNAGLFLVVLSGLFLLGIPICNIVIGSYYSTGGDAYTCPIEPYIPTWLIVQGATSLFANFVIYTILIVVALLGVSHTIESVLSLRAKHPFIFFLLVAFLGLFALVWLFTFAWFIAGNVWVFRKYSSVQSSYVTQNGGTYCHAGLYYYAFSSIIATYGLTLIGLGLLVPIGVLTLKRA